MKKLKIPSNVLLWTFVIFFSIAWVAIKVEQKYFPRKVDLTDPRFPFGV